MFTRFYQHLEKNITYGGKLNDAGVSLEASHRANYLAVTMILPAWFDLLQESFLIEKFRSKSFADM